MSLVTPVNIVFSVKSKMLGSIEETARLLRIPEGYSYEMEENGIVFNMSVQGYPDESLLDLAHRCKVPLEGACGGFMVCSTCHVVLGPEWASKLPEPASREYDVLEHAENVCDGSRLGCQVRLHRNHDGMRIFIPNCSRCGH